MGPVEIFLENRQALPSLQAYGYASDNFIFNWYGEGEPVRAGCKYSKGAEEEYLLLAEAYPGKPEISGVDSEKTGRARLLYGRVPKFPVAEEPIKNCCTHLSWARGRKVFTLINLKRQAPKTPKSLRELPGLYTYPDSKNDWQLKNLFKVISKKNPPLTCHALFDSMHYLPDSAKGWRLVTAFLCYENAGNGTQPLVRAQGNYERGGKYLNLVLRLGNKNLREILAQYRIVSRTEIGGEPAMVAENGHFLSLLHLNERAGFLLEASNNETTREWDGYRAAMKGLMAGAMRKLKKGAHQCQG